MARRPILEIDGVKFKNVYEVSYELYTAKDETGRPSDRAHAGTIKIARESDESIDIFRWAADSSKPKWKAGSVEFYNPNDEVMKTLKWKEGFITKYMETVPHVKDKPDTQIYEYFEISSHYVYFGDDPESDTDSIDNRWEE